MRGLRILRILVEAGRPMSATEIANMCDLHQSSASRILGTLLSGGYVRKDSYRSFVPDYGILALATSARSHFSIMDRPRAVLQSAAENARGLTVSLCMLWRGQLIYFLRSTAGQRPVQFEGDGYPMHMSVAALRFIAEMDDDDALALLANSRRRFGWERPTEHVPRDERAAIEFARTNVAYDCLIDDRRLPPESVAGAILLNPYEGHPLALTVHGPRELTSVDELRLLMHAVRRDFEAVIALPD